MTTLYETLLTTTKAPPPSDGEGEQEFLKRLVQSLDKDVSEEDFDAMPESAQLWTNDAILAVKHGNPITRVEGAPFGDEDEEKETAETKTGSETKTNGHDTQAETKVEPPKATAGKGKGKGATAKAPEPAAETAKKGGRPKGTTAANAAAAKPPAVDDRAAKHEAAAAKKKADKEAAAAAKAAAKAEQDKQKRVHTRTNVLPNAGDVGVLDLLLVEMHKDPTASPKQLKERLGVSHPKIEVKDGNAVGIRQQYRRVVKFLQRQGLLAEITLD